MNIRTLSSNEDNEMLANAARDSSGSYKTW
jgi:hypothetical protein